jgi:hypothetical protein
MDAHSFVEEEPHEIPDEELAELVFARQSSALSLEAQAGTRDRPEVEGPAAVVLVRQRQIRCVFRDRDVFVLRDHRDDARTTTEVLVELVRKRILLRERQALRPNVVVERRDDRLDGRVEQIERAVVLGLFIEEAPELLPRASARVRTCLAGSNS